MKAISLYSGMDGFSYAAQLLGIEVVAHVEIETVFDEHYKRHWPNAKRFYDAGSIDPQALPNAHIIFGGEPCQGNSVAGNRKGKDDDRYQWPNYFRIVKAKRPTWVINENVVGSINNMVLDQKIADLESIGYTTRAFNIPACAVGALHERQRIWLVAYTMCERFIEGPHLSSTQKGKFLQQVQKQANEGEQIFTQPARGFTGRILEMPDEQFFTVVNDVPTELAEIKAYGNAVVPWIPYVLLQFILEIENQHPCN